MHWENYIKKGNRLGEFLLGTGYFNLLACHDYSRFLFPFILIRQVYSLSDACMLSLSPEQPHLVPGLKLLRNSLLLHLPLIHPCIFLAWTKYMFHEQQQSTCCCSTFNPPPATLPLQIYKAQSLYCSVSNFLLCLLCLPFITCLRSCLSLSYGVQVSFLSQASKPCTFISMIKHYMIIWSSLNNRPIDFFKALSWKP